MSTTMDEVKQEHEIDKLKAEIAELKARERKATRETFYMPLVIGAGLMAGATALVGAVGAVIIKLLPAIHP